MSETKIMAERNTIYKCIHGSRAYGLNTPTSDTDIKGIFIPDKEYYFGMKVIEQQELGKDHVIYALKKFVQLARDCNPNIIEILYCDNEDITFLNGYGELLRDNRDLFLSKKAKFTFAGYAYAQLQRIKGHKKWINSPVTMPIKEDYMVDKTMQGSKGEVIQYRKFQEQEYDVAFKKYQQYLDWKTNRNEVRAKLEEKYGYDTKHGMHLMRLLRMGHEILKTGQVIVKRPDREELLAIRNGAWTYDKLVGEAEKLEKELDSLYEQSTLKHSPDDKAIDNLLINITEQYLK